MMANTYDGRVINLDTAGAANYVTNQGPAVAGNGDLELCEVSVAFDGAAGNVILFGTQLDGTGAVAIAELEGAIATTQTKTLHGVMYPRVYAEGVGAGAVCRVIVK